MSSRTSSVSLHFTKRPYVRFRGADKGREAAGPLGVGHGAKNSLSMYLLYWNTKAIADGLRLADTTGTLYVCEEQLEELSTVLEQVRC